MDVSGEAADLIVKESIQLTEASIKMLAAGSKNLAAFLWALSKDNKKLVGKTNMNRLLREGKELKVFRIKESDLKEFRAFARKNVLFSVVKDNRAKDGLVDLITNTDFISQVNYFMERRGYQAPSREAGAPKKAAPLAPQESCSQERGNGLPQQQRTETMTQTTDKPSVKGRLAALQAASEGMRQGGRGQQHIPKTPPKIR